MSNPTPTRVLLTGATGTVSGALLREIRDDPRFDVIALTRHRPRPAAGNVRWVRGDLADAGAIRRAAAGCEAAFLVWPFADASAAPPVLDAMADTVGHVVYLSTAGVPDRGDAADPITASHTAIERGLRARDVRATMLRSGGMASNTRLWAEQIRSGDEVRWVYGDLARPLVHEADLADVAVLALVGDPAVVGGAPSVTGPVPVTQREQVAALGAALGRDLTWVECTPHEAEDLVLAAGFPSAAVDGALAAWDAMRSSPEPVSPAERLTDRPGRDFATWAADHVDDFR